MRRDEGFLPASHATPEGSSDPTWEGKLELELAVRRAGTRLVHARHEGPLRIQRPFYPEGDGGTCHVYVLHPPGGVVTGDLLRLDTTLRRDARVLLTTPGAQKLYRARALGSAAAEAAHVTQRFVAEPGSVLEWLPHENIAYAGTRARLATSVFLEGNATYAGWEHVCLGRPASGERFEHGELRTELALRRDGRLVFLERGRYRGGDALLREPWGLHGQAVLGTLVVAAPHAEESWVAQVRAVVSPAEGRFAVTLVSRVLVARYLGSSTREARVLFECALGVLRPLYAGRAVVPPGSGAPEWT